MPAIKLYKPPALILNGSEITDHNRSSIQKNPNRIEAAQRMANGTLRKYVKATKHEWSVSWENLPNNKSFTVDGFAGADEIEALYEKITGPFTMMVVTGQVSNSSSDTRYLHQGRYYLAQQAVVHFTEFSKDLSKRGNKYDMYNVNVRMEEI